MARRSVLCRQHVEDKADKLRPQRRLRVRQFRRHRPVTTLPQRRLRPPAVLLRTRVRLPMLGEVRPRRRMALPMAARRPTHPVVLSQMVPVANSTCVGLDEGGAGSDAAGAADLISSPSSPNNPTVMTAVTMVSSSLVAADVDAGEVCNRRAMTAATTAEIAGRAAGGEQQPETCYRNGISGKHSAEEYS
jgi:hypothetical protein